MPPVKKISKQKQVCKPVKRKRTTPASADTDSEADDEGEPSLQMVIANIGAILNTLTTRMEGFEIQRATHDDTAALHLQYPLVPDADICPA